jgi:molybdate transport system permease protein
MVIQNGDYATAGFWVLVIIIIAFVIVLAMNLITSRQMKNVTRY